MGCLHSTEAKGVEAEFASCKSAIKRLQHSTDVWVDANGVHEGVHVVTQVTGSVPTSKAVLKPCDKLDEADQRSWQRELVHVHNSSQHSKYQRCCEVQDIAAPDISAFSDQSPSLPPPCENNNAPGHSHQLLQKSLPTDCFAHEVPIIKAAGLRHIGFGPLKRENQDEYFVHIRGYGGLDYGCCYCIFDGHGAFGGEIARYCCRELPILLDRQLRNSKEAICLDSSNSQPHVERIISHAFMTTQEKLQQTGLNVSNSGTTASIVFQEGNRLWVAAVGDSRVLTLYRHGNSWQPQVLTLDHRPARRGEKARVEAAGGRVEPKKLASGQAVGEPRLWLKHAPSPGLLLSRSIGDLMATSVGCTAQPEVTFLTLRPHVDHYLVLASDGVWDVLSNEQVCEIVSSADDPQRACQHVLHVALQKWANRLAADNISVVVARFDWSSAEMQVQRCSDAGT